MLFGEAAKPCFSMASCQVVNQGTDIFSFEDPAVKSDIKVQACGVRRVWMASHGGISHENSWRK
jgi:hypothetical protein